jgi:hypothetical protein
MQVVLDASCLMEFLENSEMENFQWIWERELIAPCLLRYEYNNILLCKLQSDRDTINQFRNVIHNLSIQYIDIIGEEEDITSLAIEHQLSSTTLPIYISPKKKEFPWRLMTKLLFKRRKKEGESNRVTIPHPILYGNRRIIIKKKKMAKSVIGERGKSVWLYSR